MSATLADTRSVWRVPISMQDWRVSSEPRRLTLGTILDLQPSVAGNHVAYASLNSRIDVWGLPMDTNQGQPTGPLERLTEDAFAHSWPTVSPDGTKLAFSSRRSGNRDIWVKDLRTGKESVVSKAPGPAFSPSFSPDASELVFRDDEGPAKTVSYLVTLADGKTERICEGCTHYNWSSDGKRLVLVGPGPARVSVLDLISKQRTPLLDHGVYVLENARFAPGDQWVLFNATTPGRSRIFVAPIPGSGMVPESEWIAITEGPWDEKARWSPDGNMIYFVSERDGSRCIWAQRLDSVKHPAASAFAVFHAHETRRSLRTIGFGDLGLSVASDKIVFNMSERTGNLWMLNLDESH
jgi:Tol biopolymer transport system component